MQMLDMYVIICGVHGTGVYPDFGFCSLVSIGDPRFHFIAHLGKTSVFPVRDPRLIESIT